MRGFVPRPRSLLQLRRRFFSGFGMAFELAPKQVSDGPAWWPASVTGGDRQVGSAPGKNKLKKWLTLDRNCVSYWELPRFSKVRVGSPEPLSGTLR